MCKTRASFGYEGEKSTRCSKHKDDDMICLGGRKCDDIGCKTRASFGYEGENSTRCAKHKDNGMINVDDPKCIVCGKISTYGFLGNTSIHCAVHANKRVELYRPTRRCKCKQLANHGKEYILRCEEHSLSDDRSFLTSKCSNCVL